MCTARITARWRSSLTDPKEFFLPEAQEIIGGAWEHGETEESAPDPYDRPDFDASWPEEEEAPAYDALGQAYEPCPCCGAETIPENVFPGYICPVCLWEIDSFSQSDDEPSDQNHGLSLNQARLNFQTFGCSAPWLLQEDDDAGTV